MTVLRCIGLGASPIVPNMSSTLLSDLHIAAGKQDINYLINK